MKIKTTSLMVNTNVDDVTLLLQVLSVDVQTENLVRYVEDVAKKPASARRLRHALVAHCAISGQSLI